MNVISASIRTDLPALQPEQTIQRILKMHETKPVDAVVFWTKNADPILPYLHMLGEEHIPFYFQYTLNTYGTEWEPNIPRIAERINTFQQLSKMIGKERVIWRYDPIFISTDVSIGYHITHISELANILAPYTNKCVYSFYDAYQKLGDIGVREPTTAERIQFHDFIDGFGADERYKHIQFSTCAELAYAYKNIRPNKCIDPELLTTIGVKDVDFTKNPSQRKLCGCVKSTDIGQYRTCLHGCKYCYAK